MSSPPLTLPPLSLYVHIPWCLKKCPYCDFNSHAFSGELPEQVYIDRLLADLKQELDYVQGRCLVSIFIGGGTPSLFSPKSFAQLLSSIEKLIPFSSNIEITLEANPGTFEVEKFKGFRATGINRLSIGIQSFNKNFLTALGRVHDDKEANASAAFARAAGFDNFNLDLMFGLPNQSIDEAMQDLKTALSYAPPHLSWYQLTIEPNTVFYSHPPALPEDDHVSEIQEGGIQLLAAQNLERYEISAFSKADSKAIHNINYWEFGDYLGIGAGAHGKITLPEKQKIIRTQKLKQPGAYLSTSTQSIVSFADVSIEELPLEYMMNALRLTDGTSEKLFEQRTGLSIDEITDTLVKLRSADLLKQNTLAATIFGYKFLNDVLAEFLPTDIQRAERIPVNSL